MGDRGKTRFSKVGSTNISLLLSSYFWPKKHLTVFANVGEALVIIAPFIECRHADIAIIYIQSAVCTVRNAVRVAKSSRAHVLHIKWSAIDTIRVLIGPLIVDEHFAKIVLPGLFSDGLQ